MASRPRPSKTRTGPWTARAVSWARLAAAPFVVLALVQFGPEAVGRGPLAAGEAPPPSGYDQLVNGLFVERGWIEVNYSAQGDPSIGLTRRPIGADERLIGFVNQSYLRQDFAAADLWRLDDTGEGVAGIDPFAHFVPRPFAAADAWKGDILFASGAGEAFTLTALDGAQGGLRLTAGAAGGSPACVIDMTRARFIATEPVGAGLVCVQGGREAARLILAGDRLLLRVENGLGLEIALGGEDPLAVGEGGMTLTPLQPGQILSLTYGDRGLEMLVDRSPQTVSRLPKNGERVTHPGLGPLADGLVAAMGPGSSDLRVSLDGELQAVAQAALDTEARRLQGAGGDAFPASVTLMDAMTGEILAMASYPSTPGDLTVAQRKTRQGQRLITQNQNLRRHVIGSTAKAPLGMAILDADPILATLKIAPGGNEPIRTILGIDMGREFGNHGSGGEQIGFATFLETSSNRYALALMLMAIGEDPARSYDGMRSTETWSLNGQNRTDIPRLPLFKPDDQPGEFGMKPELPASFVFPWGERLEALFDVESQQRVCPETDLGVWRGLAARADARFNANDCGSLFSAVSPEREFLGLNTVSSLSEQYLMDILGGARSVWTSVKLAEVYSRIVTGLQVRARLTPRIDDDIPEAAPDPLELRSQASRADVMAGLAQVVSGPNGTAARLGAQFRTFGYGESVTLYGKTGTANLDPPSVQGAANLALQRLARDCTLRWDAASARLHLGPAAPPGEDEARAVALAAPMSPRCRGHVDTVGASAIIAEMNRQGCASPRPGCRPRGFTPEASGVVRTVETNLNRLPAGSPPTSHTFAAVVARRAAPGSDGPPVRALTVVINLLKRTEANKTPALTVAQVILGDRAVRDWVLRNPQPVLASAGSGRR